MYRWLRSLYLRLRYWNRGPINEAKGRPEVAREAGLFDELTEVKHDGNN